MPIPLLRHFGRGGKEGLEQTGNTGKMTIVIVGPFVAVWFLLQLFVPEEWIDIATIISFVGWIAYVVLLYAKQKAASVSYLPFPQAHWRFPDGQQQSYDILLPPNCATLIADYEDGATLYRVGPFKDKVAYQDPNRPYPDVFDTALWKLPADFNDTFQRNGHGEFFFETLFVDHPACEFIEVSVVGWEECGSTRTPICVITGCTYNYMQAAMSGGVDFPNPQKTTYEERLLARNKVLKNLNAELTARNLFLEDENEQYATKEPQDIKRLSDKRLERIRNQVDNIMDTRPPKTRLLNLKTLAFVILILAVVFIATHFIAGWP